MKKKKYLSQINIKKKPKVFLKFSIKVNELMRSIIFLVLSVLLLFFCKSHLLYLSIDKKTSLKEMKCNRDLVFFLNKTLKKNC